MPGAKQDKKGNNHSRSGGTNKTLTPIDPTTLNLMLDQISSNTLHELNLIRESDFGMGYIAKKLIETLIDKRIIAITDVSKSTIKYLHQSKSLQQKQAAFFQLFDSDELNTR